MFGRIITALAGQAAARSVGGTSGMAAMIAGTAVPLIARRFGPLGMIGLAAGAYVARRLTERRAGTVTARPEAPRETQLP